MKKRKKIPIGDRLKRLSIPEPNSGCWLWIGGVNNYGYGIMGVDGKSASAHKVSYIHTHGDIPKGKVIMHSCDVPCCINPDHLSLGTVRDNVDDMVKKGRQAFGERHWRAGLNIHEVRHIRSSARLLIPELAKKYNISERHVRRIMSGERWGLVE